MPKDTEKYRDEVTIIGQNDRVIKHHCKCMQTFNTRFKIEEKTSSFGKQANDGCAYTFLVTVNSIGVHFYSLAKSLYFCYYDFS